MKPVEEYFPLTFLVILYALLLLVLVTGGGEVTETNVDSQTFTDAVYTADNLDTDEDVSSPVRYRVDVYQDVKR